MATLTQVRLPMATPTKMDLPTVATTKTEMDTATATVNTMAVGMLTAMAIRMVDPEAVLPEFLLQVLMVHRCVDRRKCLP